MIRTVKSKKYRPIDGVEGSYSLVKTTRKNRRAIARIIAESTYFGIGHRYKYARMAGIHPVKHVELPDTQPAMEIVEKIVTIGEASLDDLKKLQKEIQASPKTRQEPVYELEDKYDEDGLIDALAGVLFEGLQPGYDTEALDEGVVWEAFSDFWMLRAGMTEGPERY